MKFFKILKVNKLVVLLVLVIILMAGFIVRNLYPVTPSILESSPYKDIPPSFGKIGASDSTSYEEPFMRRSGEDYSDSNMVASPGQNMTVARMQAVSSYISILVKDVQSVIDKIKDKTYKLGGFMVSSDMSYPGEDASGSITVRVPVGSRQEALDTFKSYGIKVVAESLEGRDINDQYSDVESRLSLLNKNKKRFEEIMSSAKEVNDILRVQQEIFNLQTQIDSLKGQKKYLEEESKMSKITVYLSSDELSLPYVPENSWRPDVIFKKAVRSLVATVQGVGSLLIWLIVYSVLLVPTGVAIWWLFFRRKV